MLCPKKKVGLPPLKKTVAIYLRASAFEIDVTVTPRHRAQDLGKIYVTDGKQGRAKRDEKKSVRSPKTFLRAKKNTETEGF